MSIIQIILIALFVYLGSIGSIVGNTIGWYTLGRPLVAAFVVGVILGDIQTAMVVGIPLQIMYMATSRQGAPWPGTYLMQPISASPRPSSSVRVWMPPERLA